MHGIHAGLARRLERLERRLGAVLEPETDAEYARRLVLCRAALRGETAANLTPEELPVFSKIVASVPIFEELIADGLVDDHGRPTGGDDYRDDLPHEDGDGRPVWSP